MKKLLALLIFISSFLQAFESSNNEIQTRKSQQSEITLKQKNGEQGTLGKSDIPNTIETAETAYIKRSNAWWKRFCLERQSNKLHLALLISFFGLGLPTLIKLARNDFRTYPTDKYIKIIQAGSFIAAFSLLMWSIKFQHANRPQNINTDLSLEIKQMLYNA